MKEERGAVGIERGFKDGGNMREVYRWFGIFGESLR